MIRTIRTRQDVIMRKCMFLLIMIFFGLLFQLPVKAEVTQESADDLLLLYSFSKNAFLQKGNIMKQKLLQAALYTLSLVFAISIGLFPFVKSVYFTVETGSKPPCAGLVASKDCDQFYPSFFTCQATYYTVEKDTIKAWTAESLPGTTCIAWGCAERQPLRVHNDCVSE